MQVFSVSLTMLVVMRKWLASLGRKWSCRASRSAPSLEVRGHTEVRVPMEVRTPTEINMKPTTTLASTRPPGTAVRRRGLFMSRRLSELSV